MTQKNIFTLSLVLASYLISACQSNIPESIKQPIEDSPTLHQVLQQPQNHLQQQVRWGGIITENNNQQSSSQLIIVGYPLNSSGRPDIHKITQGRFIAEVSGFLEPEVYKKPREITVTGTLSTMMTRSIGQYPYDYPVIKVEQYHLWPIKTEPVYRDPPPFWYDPWYHPYHFYDYPYYLPPHWHYPTIPKELIKKP